MAKRVSFAFPAAMNRGKNLPPSYWLPVYGRLSGEGYKNSSKWIS